MRSLSFGLFLLLAAPPGSPGAAARQAAVDAVLDDWHAAAAAADEARYFTHFARDAVFLGTDGAERWNREEFQKYAHPHFAKGKAWSFKASGRHVSFSPDGAVAWFDEALETRNPGPCRGSGVLLLEKGKWKIAQYNLSVPIPNDLVSEVKERIEKYEKGRRAPAR